MKVLLSRKFFKEDIEYIQSKLVSGNISLIDPLSYTEQDLIKEFSRHSIQVMLGDSFSDNILAVAKDLHLIQVPWTGVDRIDFSILKKHNVVLCNSHSNDMAVAEHAVTLMLSLLRMIPYHDKELRRGNWCRPNDRDFFHPPTSLVNASVGFIGYGAIAKRIRQLLNGFNCNYNAIVNIPHKHLNEGISFIGQRDQIIELARRSKFIFVSAALTEKTKGIVDADFLAALGPSGYLVNISRGELVNEGDLFNSLESNQIAGAALDTWYRYPTLENKEILPSRFSFHLLDNVILSPHRAGFLNNQMPHLDQAIENINRLYLKKDLINIVNINESY